MNYALVLTLLLLAMLAPSPAARKIPPEKAVIEFKAAAGVVTFKHEDHATKYGIACEKCHHTLQPASQETPKACSSCHLKTEGPKIPSLRNAVHKKCWDCHKLERAKGKKAPVQIECNGCHVRAKA